MEEHLAWKDYYCGSAEQNVVENRVRDRDTPLWKDSNLNTSGANVPSTGG